MELTLILLSTMMLSGGVRGAGDIHWNHNLTDRYGPYHWADYFPGCGNHNMQSPIHIHTDDTRYDHNLRAFTFTGYSSPTAELTLENTAHGVKASITGNHPEISEGGLGDTYILQQFHFHSGLTNARGSEHLLDDGELAGEVHFVHYHGDLEHHEVTDYSGGIAVLGVLLKAGGPENADYENVFGYMNTIKETGEVHAIPSFALEKLLPDNTRDYFRYNGSLTTPPCAPAVIWTVFKDVVYVSDEQISRFRDLKYEETEIKSSFRPTFPLEGRIVTVTWLDEQDNTSGANRPQTLYTVTMIMLTVAMASVFRHIH